MKRDLLRLLAGLLAITGLFSSCATQNGGSADASMAGNEPSMKRRTAPSPSMVAEERPGLATGWGEEKASSITGQSFVRASSKPAGTDVIYYNNKQGVEAMATGFKEKIGGMQTAAGDLVEWGIKGRGGFLPTYKTYVGGHRRLVAGESNSTYTIAIRNRSKSTLEIVASVDGLDVLDGKTASFSKRGYLVDPGRTLEIDGFRTSEDTVAAFKFSSVSNSYANLRHGDTRNVGVIGIAVFTQKNVNPWTWMPEEIRKREGAQPFAQAPGR